MTGSISPIGFRPRYEWWEGVSIWAAARPRVGEEGHWARVQGAGLLSEWARLLRGRWSLYARGGDAVGDDLAENAGGQMGAARLGLDLALHVRCFACGGGAWRAAAALRTSVR